MCCDGLDNEEVTINNEEQRHEVDKDAINQDIRSGEQVFGQVVGTAGSHVALGHVAVEILLLPYCYYIIYIIYV